MGVSLKYVSLVRVIERRIADNMPENSSEVDVDFKTWILRLARAATVTGTGTCNDVIGQLHVHRRTTRLFHVPYVDVRFDVEQAEGDQQRCADQGEHDAQPEDKERPHPGSINQAPGLNFSEVAADLELFGLIFAGYVMAIEFGVDHFSARRFEFRLVKR